MPNVSTNTSIFFQGYKQLFFYYIGILYKKSICYLLCRKNTRYIEILNATKEIINDKYW